MCCLSAEASSGFSSSKEHKSSSETHMTAPKIFVSPRPSRQARRSLLCRFGSGIAGGGGGGGGSRTRDFRQIRPRTFSADRRAAALSELGCIHTHVHMHPSTGMDASAGGPDPQNCRHQVHRQPAKQSNVAICVANMPACLGPHSCTRVERLGQPDCSRRQARDLRIRHAPGVQDP